MVTGILAYIPWRSGGVKRPAPRCREHNTFVKTQLQGAWLLRPGRARGQDRGRSCWRLYRATYPDKAVAEPIRQRVAALRARDEIDDHRAVKLELEPALEQLPLAI